MSVTLSPPVRVFAFLGVLVAAGAGAFLLFLGAPGAETVDSPTTPVTRPLGRTQTAPRPTTPAPRTRPTRSAVTPSGFPLPVHRALRRYSVVVVAVYMPNASVDAGVRSEARAAAKATRAGFVAVSAVSERLVRPLVAKTGILPDPAVIVVKRPDVVVATFGVTDRLTIAQAVAQARK